MYRPEQWSSFARCLHNLEALTLNPISSSPKEAPDALANLANAITQGLHREWKPTQLPVIQAMLDSGSRSASFGNTWGIGCTSPWLPFDVYMESAMEKQRLQVVSPSEYLAGLLPIHPTPISFTTDRLKLASERKRFWFGNLQIGEMFQHLDTLDGISREPCRFVMEELASCYGCSN